MYVCSSSSICSTVPHKTDCRIEEVSIRMYMKQRTALFFCRSKKTHDARILGDRRKAVPSGTLMAAVGGLQRSGGSRWGGGAQIVAETAVSVCIYVALEALESQLSVLRPL